MYEALEAPRTLAEIDEQIIRLAEQQGALDEQIGRWLLLAHRARLHRHFGMASFAEYIERRLGYSPRLAKERARVAEALEGLPALRSALMTGARAFSATKELVRVATAETELEWLRVSEAKTVREVERLVSGLRPGDLPTGEKDPLLVAHRRVVTLTSDQKATLLDAEILARRTLGPQATDGEVWAAIAEGFLGRSRAPDEQAGYQVAVTVCTECDRTFRPVGGETIEVSETIRDCACCDGELSGLAPAEAAEAHGNEAQAHVGEDAPPTVAVLRTLIRQGGLSAVLRETSKALGFTLQTVSPKLRQIVLARDGHRCTVPGCRNALFIDLHHLQKARDGGPNNPENLITLCSAHHRQHHAGYLGIEGTPSTGLVFTTRHGTLYGHVPRRSAAGPKAVRTSPGLSEFRDPGQFSPDLIRIPCLSDVEADLRGDLCDRNCEDAIRLPLMDADFVQ